VGAAAIITSAGRLLHPAPDAAVSALWWAGCALVLAAVSVYLPSRVARAARARAYLTRTGRHGRHERRS
jgi:hypothetical protein